MRGARIMRASMNARQKKRLNVARVASFIMSVVGDDMHAKRVLSLADASLGVIHAASLAVSAIGQALAQAKGLKAKHAIKQVDRLLSNKNIGIWNWFGYWVPYIVGSRSEIVVALDWTEFDKDDQSTLAIYMVTHHGRATPLMWMTVVKSELAGQRNAHEDLLLMRFQKFLPKETAVTVLADRGFGDADLYTLHWSLGFNHIIRFRGNITVTNSKGESRPAVEWLFPNGRARILRDATVTARGIPVAAVVCVWAKGMKEPWFLACGEGCRTKKAAAIVKLYGRRFTIEEGFRDSKDIRFGMGLSSTRVGIPERRDRLLLLSAVAVALLTLLGAAGENVGFDRYLKANTVKRRTHSLFTQGCYYYGAIPNMPAGELKLLMDEFARLLSEQPAFNQLFGVL